jgi:WhiB family transcriptional regulator, redox-sensing transcriptional regulator
MTEQFDRSRGACGSVEPDIFFPTSTTSGKGLIDTKRAITICQTCPIRIPCLNFAMENDEIHGIWGGTTPEERRRAKRTAAGLRMTPTPSSSGKANTNR